MYSGHGDLFESAVLLEKLRKDVIENICKVSNTPVMFCTLMKSFATMILSDVALQIPEDERAEFFIKFVYVTKTATESRELKWHGTECFADDPCAITKQDIDGIVDGAFDEIMGKNDDGKK